MQDLQLIYIILPLALAVVILSLVLILISQLRKEIRLSNLKPLADKYMIQIENVTKIMENRMAEFNNRLELRIKSGNEILDKVDTQIGELSGYSEDLSNLKSAMTTYHQALNELTELTAKSDDEIKGLEQRSDVISRVNAAISEFEQKFEEHRRAIMENENHLNKVRDDFERKSFERMGSFDTGMNDRISACESRIGGVIGGFEARVASDLKRFDAQMSTSILECQDQITKDVESHEARIRSIKESYFSEFTNQINSRLTDNITRLDDAFSAVAATVKELSTELDERSTALRDLIGGLDGGVDEKIRELENRYTLLEGEREELKTLNAQKAAALQELEDLNQEKILLESLIQNKIKDAENAEEPQVTFIPPVPIIESEPEPMIEQEAEPETDYEGEPELGSEPEPEPEPEPEQEPETPDQKFVPIGESEEIKFD